MNTKNLILTSTVDMNREEWLAFRKPLNHIKKFIEKSFSEGDTKGTWTNGLSALSYTFLKSFFKDDNRWKDFKFPCIGASEISSLVGLNPYKAVIELFYEKVGIKETFDQDNIAMFWGRELEEQIAQKWQYWDGSAEGMIENFKNDNVIRRCRRMNAYVQNKAFPWIFVSVDRIINKQGDTQEGLNECKTISGYAANMWQEGIPPMYVAQLQTQLKVTELDNGEMTILKDGRQFEVLPFDFSQQITDRLLLESERFFEAVKAGAAEYLLGLYAPDGTTRLQHYANIDKYAPEPDGSTSYEKYLNESNEDKGFEIAGGIAELDLAFDYKYFAGQIKALETLQRERSNKLKAIMKEASKIDFGIEGNCTWRQNAKARPFLVNVTPGPGYKPDSMKPDLEGHEVVEVEIPQDIDTGTKRKGAKKVV